MQSDKIQSALEAELRTTQAKVARLTKALTLLFGKEEPLHDKGDLPLQEKPEKHPGKGHHLRKTRHKCSYCGKGYLSSRRWSKYCSVRCKSRDYHRTHPYKRKKSGRTPAQVAALDKARAARWAKKGIVLKPGDDLHAGPNS